MLLLSFSQPNRMESRFINASFNYWGHTGDTNDIGARILDQYDNKTLMQVNFYPPYTDSNRLRQGSFLQNRFHEND